MGMNILKGVQKTYLKAVLYGVEGIGKTTFGSKAEKPLFLDFEKGTNQLDVDRIPVSSYTELLQIIANLAKSTGGYKLLVVDTADWLEKYMCQWIIAKENVTSIEKVDGGFGKGWVMVEETWLKLLDKINELKMDILILAHSEIKRFDLPEEDGTPDRYTLKLSKKGSAVLKEWPDALLFAKYKTMVSVNEKTKKAKAQGQRRVLYTSHNASWDAKNRFGLKAEVPFEYKEVKHIFNQIDVTEPAKKTATVKEVMKKSEVKADPIPETITTSSDNPKVAELRTLLELSGVSEAEVEAQMTNLGTYSAGTKITAYSDSSLTKIIAGWEEFSGMIQAGKTEGLIIELEALMKADGIEAAQVEAKVVEKKKGSGPYKEYDADLLTFIIGAWAFLAKTIKGE